MPGQEEQQKIASFLSLVDKKIEKQGEKVESVKEYKKGMMQKIFSREIRFKDDEGKEFPEWEEKKLGDISKITTGNRNVDDNVINGEYRFFDRGIDSIKYLNGNFVRLGAGYAVFWLLAGRCPRGIHAVGNRHCFLLCRQLAQTSV